MQKPSSDSLKHLWLPVVVGALGYFVDIYDLVLFSIVRVASLRSIGVPDAQLLDTGVLLLNAQMSGMLVGGIAWGILGDKKGRLSVLFGSIFLYSIANIANGFVTTVDQYAVLRFIAGIGLAGELGAAITLVSEVLPKDKRGYGTAVVAGIGLSGAVVAGLIGDKIAWNWAYVVGGCLGLVLLFLRIGILESELFHQAKETQVVRGDLKMLLLNKERLLKYVACIAVGFPIWFSVGILVTFSPEIGNALGVADGLKAGRAIMFCYAGLAIGDLLSGFLSQIFKSRRKIVIGFLAGVALCSVLILTSHGVENHTYYNLCFLLGLFTGYWAVFVTIAAEQFGTNLRATVTTSVPNFVRGAVVPMTLSFQSMAHSIGVVKSAAVVGSVTCVLALIAILSLSETYGKDLNYMEVE